MSGPREGAIFPLDWPRCWDGTIKLDWDEPWERLQNLYERYICRGFTFWQGDLAGPGSGAAHRFFSFGQIEPGGDFDGDGQLTQEDRTRYLEQWHTWSNFNPPPGSALTLTYYHGDLDSDGDVDDWDKLRAVGPGPNGTPGFGVIGIQVTPYYLGEEWEFPNGTHKMNWDPNQLWLPCPVNPSGSMGPSGGPP